MSDRIEDLLLPPEVSWATASFSGMAGTLGRCFDIVWSYAEFCLGVRFGGGGERYSTAGDNADGLKNAAFKRNCILGSNKVMQKTDDSDE